MPGMYQHDAREEYRLNWLAAGDKRQLYARHGIQNRMSIGRGSILTGTLVLAGLVGSAEVALITAFFREPGLRVVTKLLIVALVLLCIGIMPPVLTALFPRHRKAEGKEALEREQWEWDYEDVRRSSHQRSQLWRMGAFLCLSLLCTIAALLQLFFII